VRAAIAIASIGLVVAAWHDRFRADRLDVVFVSVGQGDATIVRMPGGRVLVVDAGLPGRGRLAVAPYLRRLRIGRIDYLVASHVQDDHWGGLPEVAERLEVGEFWHPGGQCPVPRFTDFVRTLTERGVDVIDVGALRARGGILRRTGPQGWEIEAVWPGDSEGSCSANARSIVLSVRYAGRTLVLTGDIEAATEHSLTRSAEVSADLMKVPHHGSATSSTSVFLAAASPAIAVASVGQNNRYGLPRPEIEARYRDAGASFFRTDRDGAVVATVGATGVTVRAAKRR
jgi:competence protein ComEC